MENLASFFAKLGYYFEKTLGGTTLDKRDTVLGVAGLLAIKNSLQNFKEAVAKRGVDYESINYVCELLDYPLTELEVFFQNAQAGKELNINEKTAYIFASPDSRTDIQVLPGFPFIGRSVKVRNGGNPMSGITGNKLGFIVGFINRPAVFKTVYFQCRIR